MTTMADAVRARREELRLSQAALATRANVSRGWLSQLELGLIPEPSAQRLSRLAQALGLSSATLLGENERSAVVLAAQITEARVTAAKLLGMLAEMDPAASDDAVATLVISTRTMQEELAGYATDIAMGDAVNVMIAVVSSLRREGMAIAAGSLLSSTTHPYALRDRVMAAIEPCGPPAKPANGVVVREPVGALD